MSPALKYTTHQEAEMDALLERAGLAEVVSVYTSAIEIDQNTEDGDGCGWNGYSVLAALVDRVRQEAYEFILAQEGADSGGA